jgi:hypothetical protein
MASTVGAVVGLAGLEHGFFEMLQGNATPSGIVIDAIGPAQELWPGASERAITVIPNFLVTGILAMVMGLLVTIWAVAFVQRKHGAWILFLLSIVLFLVGGGAAPIVLALSASAVATRIGKPLTWWRAHLSVKARGHLAKLWPWSIIAFVLVFWSSVVIQVTGLPLTLFLDANTTDISSVSTILGYVSLVLLLFSAFTGFAYDIQRRDAE